MRGYKKTIEKLEVKLEAQREVAQRMRRLKYSMAEQRRAAEAKAATSERRLERAQEAEQLVQKTQS